MILDKIVAKKKERVEILKKEKPLNIIINEAHAFNQDNTCQSFFNALSEEESLAIIAEIKKASPSKGVLCHNFDPHLLASQYQAGGAKAISVITEEDFFQGDSNYLAQLSKKFNIPFLRKDFLFDEYQLYESKTLGASAVLLIASILEKEQLQDYIELAKSLQMDPLVEVHNMLELEKALEVGAKIMGINNRNLKTFKTSLTITEELAKYIPQDCLLVSESGIKDINDMKRLSICGAHAVLIGEILVKSSDPGKELAGLVNWQEAV